MRNTGTVKSQMEPKARQKSFVAGKTLNLQSFCVKCHSDFSVHRPQLEFSALYSA
jgi:hypothetical protein